MWEIFLATVISLSVGVREPRNVPDAPFDYELSYKLENNYNDLDLSFKHDYEREDGDYFTDRNHCRRGSAVRYKWRGLSFGYGMIWDLKNEYVIKPSAGFSKKLISGKWKLETENDLYYTKPLTYQTEAKITYDITDNIGIGLSGNYIEALNDYDYSAKVVITIKLG